MGDVTIIEKWDRVLRGTDDAGTAIAVVQEALDAEFYDTEVELIRRLSDTLFNLLGLSSSRQQSNIQAAVVAAFVLGRRIGLSENE